VDIRRVDSTARISISDTGIGIASQDLPRIFERFYRVDKARSRQTGGTGLGLSIVRNIVERSGGWVTVDSQPGKGSVFTLNFPAA
jgi:two-component system phosphate regulon sensor histidine kinase PhoR